ncbi:myc box-dependent-interacting protein 1 isoform X1 [Tribolium castaneum]|uniref:myc box-dependent-interacting protein 1 isoform X1 n=1 Tax=Tribolium castaneum TaxID=7070 RepID=UPI0000D5563C|nr:PREDICTED: myc box-dependent-interacting protein 1 isoform X1 [Tribolium castaneum]|eukprot:XP_966444.1 PREDICTED: myc box-dependent-interacting protein 1 isoform X1 [Tribolium castaneum]
MAESRGSLLAKSVQKHAGRAKEKILQNLGKVDRTADEIFDEHLQNFTRQQNAANRIQKEFNNYIRCIRAAQAASKSLLEAIGETYESQWTGHDLLYVQTQQIDMLWQDFSHKLADQVLLPLNTYQSQFPEMRKKIDKRGRKLVDFDSQRHSFQALQTNMKKRDDAKIAKGREQLEEAKRTYEMLNSELHDELPALYDSRILFYVTNLQSLFNAEHVFHSEASKIYGELESVVDKLATDSQRGSYSLKKTNGSSLPRPADKNSSPLIINNISPISSPHPEDLTQSPTKKDPPKNETTQLYANDPTPTTPPKSNSTPATPVEPVTPPAKTNPPETNGETTPDGKTPSQEPSAPANEKASINNAQNNKNVQELYDIPVGASTDNLPPGVLYRVKATYKYNREDVDELSFDVGEIIQVVEYDDPEEQEEGWLMGLKENTGEKGMFPANFTRPL